MANFITEKIPKCLFDHVNNLPTVLGLVLIILIVALIVLIRLISQGVTCPSLSCSSIISSFSSPEDKIMRTKSIEIKPLNIKQEPFNNDLPNPKVDLTAGSGANGITESSSDYSDIIAGEALEKSVFDQHKAYVSEKNKVTNTASRNPARSDSQDLIPFVGLRRPQYQVAGKDMVDSTARQVPSVIDANQLAKPNNLRWN